jgi:hypothetical protein
MQAFFEKKFLFLQKDKNADQQQVKSAFLMYICVSNSPVF